MKDPETINDFWNNLTELGLPETFDRSDDNVVSVIKSTRHFFGGLTNTRAVVTAALGLPHGSDLSDVSAKFKRLLYPPFHPIPAELTPEQRKLNAVLSQYDPNTSVALSKLLADAMASVGTDEDPEEFLMGVVEGAMIFWRGRVNA